MLVAKEACKKKECCTDLLVFHSFFVENNFTITKSGGL